MRYALVPAGRAYLSLDAFARRCGLHPELVRRWVALGLLEPHYDPAGRMWFPPGQLAAAARVQRLRTGLALNYAAVGVVVDLLDRVARLEAALRHRGDATGRDPDTGGEQWTRTD